MSEKRSIGRNKISNLTKKRRRDYRRRRYGDGGISPMSVDESQEYQGKHEEVSFISSKKGITIDLTVTSESDTISVVNILIMNEL